MKINCISIYVLAIRELENKKYIRIHLTENGKVLHQKLCNTADK